MKDERNQHTDVELRQLLWDLEPGSIAFGGLTISKFETHGFASLPHNRFAFIVCNLSIFVGKSEMPLKTRQAYLTLLNNVLSTVYVAE